MDLRYHFFSDLSIGILKFFKVIWDPKMSSDICTKNKRKLFYRNTFLFYMACGYKSVACNRKPMAFRYKPVVFNCKPTACKCKQVAFSRKPTACKCKQVAFSRKQTTCKCKSAAFNCKSNLRVIKSNHSLYSFYCTTKTAL